MGIQTLTEYVRNFADKRALYDWEERAGIHEYDGKVSRAQAEVQAFKDVFPTLTLPSCYDHISKTSNG